MAFANAPTFASVHAGTMATIETITAQNPITHHQRGQMKIEPAATRKVSAAINDEPNSGESAESIAEARPSESTGTRT